MLHIIERITIDIVIISLSLIGFSIWVMFNWTRTRENEIRNRTSSPAMAKTFSSKATAPLVLLLVVLMGMSALTSCTTTTSSNGTKTTNVSLPIVQSEVRAIDGAVDVLAPGLEKSMKGPVLIKTQLAVEALDASSAAVENVTMGESPTQILETFDGAAQVVVALLPLPAATGTAVEAGLVIADAFLAGLPTATIPATSAPTTTTVAAALDAPPVEIPLQ